MIIYVKSNEPLRNTGFTALYGREEMGYHLILATNPVFPPVATHSRIRWAGLVPEDFEYITTYDNSSNCKPNPLYYRELVERLGLDQKECLMAYVKKLGEK